MKHISFLIKPASSLCNMRCRYCFYFDETKHRKIPNYGIMNNSTSYALIDKALNLDENANITFAFQGGEPTLAGITYFKDFVDYVNSHKKNQTIHYSIQTNASTINNDWCKFFHDHHFLVGISLDGYSENHNYFRIYQNNKDTSSTVLKSINLLKKWNIDFNILTVLTSNLSKHPKKVFNFYKNLNFQYIQFIPCFPGINETENQYSLHPAEFAYFYKNIFKLWLEEFNKGNYINITLFDNLLMIFKGIYPQQCGMLGQCSPQFVIESNGDVYPCDFYVLDEYKCGNIVQNTLTELLQSINLKKFLNEPRKDSLACKNCPFENICHRNCKRMNFAYYNEEYCGYKDFLLSCGEELQYIASHFV